LGQARGGAVSPPCVDAPLVRWPVKKKKTTLLEIFRGGFPICWLGPQPGVFSGKVVQFLFGGGFFKLEGGVCRVGVGDPGFRTRCSVCRPGGASRPTVFRQSFCPNHVLHIVLWDLFGVTVTTKPFSLGWGDVPGDMSRRIAVVTWCVGSCRTPPQTRR